MFPRLDVGELAAKHRIAETAIAEGRRDLPATTDRNLDANQTTIVNELNEYLEKARSLAIAELQRGLSKIREVDSKIRARPFDQECLDVVSAFELSATTLEAAKRDGIQRLRVAERTLRRDLNYFRAKNDLHREADYPDSRILHWAIVVAMIVLESLANAYFFAEGSELGLTGGWLQSLIVSLLIILSSARLVGQRTIPLLNHVSIKWNVIGGLLLALYAALLFAFALLVAHYRLLLTTDPENALLRTLPHYLSAPFELDPVSWTFFGVSIVFGLSAMIAGYTSDDHYPGYGRLDRRHKAAEATFVAQKEALIEALNRSNGDGAAKIAGLVTEMQTLIQQRRAEVVQAKTLVEDLKAYAGRVQDTCNTLLQAYRDNNKKVRTAQVPLYFADSHSYGDRATSGLPTLDELDNQTESHERALKSLLDKAAQARAELRASLDRRHERLNRLFADIDVAADQSIKVDAALGT